MIRLGILCLLAGTQTTMLAGQVSVEGQVRDRSGKPVSDARVRAIRSGSATVTGRDGAFRLDSVTLPDTLVFTAVGFRPDSIIVLEHSGTPLSSVLEHLTLLEELAVSAEREPQVPRPAQLGEWSLGQRAIRAAPPAIEADVLRSLALVPAVSFSSVLSARPLVRGYEPNQTTIRVDGFEMPNLYRIGRALSSFPADATERVTVVTPPGGDLAGGLSGHIDMVGRRGRAAGFGGGGLSFGSLGAFAGGRPGGVGAFGALRFLHLSGVSLAAGQKLPATFIDAYSRLDFGEDSDPRGTVTAFYSGDEYGDPGDRNGARWHSVLLGGRASILRGRSGSVGVEMSSSRFSQDIFQGPTRRTNIDVRTRLGLARMGIAGRIHPGPWDLGGGVSVLRREVENAVRPSRRRFSRELAPYEFTGNYTEAHGFGSLSWSDSTTSISAGARLESTPWSTTVAPQLALQRRLTDGLSAGVGIGRTAAGHQYVSDPASEPDAAFYDYWIAAGKDGFPTPVIDHGSLDLRFTRGAIQARATGFWSAGRNLIEVRPPTSHQFPDDLFRTGRSRTAGVELQLTLSPTARPDRVASLIYVLSRSQRNWGAGWMPWALDRRHMARVQLASTIARRWRVDVLADATSGPPFTPVAGILTTPAVHVAQPGSPFIFAPENSARDLTRFRADVGFTHHFNGPGKSRLLWGISVLNITWGPVLPLLPEERLAPDAGSPIGYKRYRRVPMMPTLTLRAEF